MELITYRITLDTNRNGVQRTLQGFETGDNLAREIRVSLTDGKETVEIPLDNSVVASMYITTPSGVLCINDCEIDGNDIVYKLLDTDTLEAGIVQMQLKLIAEDKVLVSPRFALDVWESSVDDSEAIANPVFNALENALREAREAYNKSVASVIIDEDYLFVVRYKDGSEYTSSVLQDALKLLDNVEQYIEEAKAAAITATSASASAENYAGVAERSALNASDSATIAQASESEALRAEVSAINAKEAAQRAESNAYIYAEQAAQAEGFSDKARADADRAESARATVEDAKDVAVESASQATSAASSVLANSKLAESYAHGMTGTREGEDTDNAWYYMKQAQSASSGGLLPSGNVTFEQLMALTDVRVGAMYHVTTEFTTNSSFEDYALLGPEEYPAGTNVYYKSDGKWCAMVGSEVIGIKGEAEESYRTGHVNITKENLGIGIATDSKVGLVKVDNDTITVGADGTIKATTKVDIATTSKAGIVKPDGSSITVGADGSISAPKQSYTASEIATSDGSNVEAKLGNLGDDVSALNENLTSISEELDIDFTGADTSVQDVNTLLQKLLNQFYPKELKALIPNITSPDTHVSASSTYQNTNVKDYGIYNSNTTLYWHSALDQAPAWNKYSFDEKHIVSKIAITYSGNANKTIKIQGSNDDIVWDDLLTLELENTNETRKTKERDIISGKAYYSYRIYCEEGLYTSKPSALYCGINQIQYYGV